MNNMNKMNFDISKYSCQELMEIFNLKEITNLNQIENHINNYRNNLFHDSILENNQKTNATEFLDSAFSKLKNELVKNAPYNNPVIENVNTKLGESVKISDGKTTGSGKFPPGNLNPINIRTIKKILSIDTRFRDPYYNTKSTDFMLNLPDSFKRVVSMSISSIQIPLCIYSISKTLGTTNFSIDNSNVILDEGNYSNFSGGNNDNNDCPYIETAINNKLNNLSPDISFGIDKPSQKCYFTNNGNSSFSINFNKDPSGNLDLNTPLPLKLGWLLGFRGGEYNLNSSNKRIISEGICSITGPKYIYVCINDFNNAGNNYYVGAFTDSIISPDIIARLNYQGLLQDATIYKYSEYSDEVKIRTREYFGPVNIQKLHIQILDEYGRVVDLNNMDWSFILNLEILYD